jgi:hypothetical protein
MEIPGYEIRTVEMVVHNLSPSCHRHLIQVSHMLGYKPRCHGGTDA